MRESPVYTLRHHFERLKDDALHSALSHFTQYNSKTHKELVDGNCGEVISQGVNELLSSLLEDIPEDKSLLLAVTKRSQAELAKSLKSDLLGCMQRMGPEERKIIIKALDISDSKPQAICEQILINGLDAYLSQLLHHHKLEPIAKAFGVEASAEDAVEQIIDQVFPPPDAVGEVLTHKKKEPAKPAAPKPKAAPKPLPPPPPPSERLSLADQNDFLRSTRPPLQKGITLEDIQNMYWLDELKKFCRENSIKCQPKKALLNRAVFQFVNSGQVPVVKAPGKRRGAGGLQAKKKARLAAQAAGADEGEGEDDEEGEGEPEDAAVPEGGLDNADGIAGPARDPIE